MIEDCRKYAKGMILKLQFSTDEYNTKPSYARLNETKLGYKIFCQQAGLALCIKVLPYVQTF